MQEMAEMPVRQRSVPEPVLQATRQPIGQGLKSLWSSPENGCRLPPTKARVPIRLSALEEKERIREALRSKSRFFK